MNKFDKEQVRKWFQEFLGEWLEKDRGSDWDIDKKPSSDAIMAMNLANLSQNTNVSGSPKKVWNADENGKISFIGGTDPLDGASIPTGLGDKVIGEGIMSQISKIDPKEFKYNTLSKEMWEDAMKYIRENTKSPEGDKHHPLKGSIDDPKRWDRKLSDKEAEDVYDKGMDIPLPEGSTGYVSVAYQAYFDSRSKSFKLVGKSGRVLLEVLGKGEVRRQMIHSEGDPSFIDTGVFFQDPEIYQALIELFNINTTEDE